MAMKEDSTPSPPSAVVVADGTANNNNNKTEIPEASPEDTTEVKKQASSPSRRTLYLLAGIALTIAIVLCIVLPLTLIDNDDDESSKNNASRNRSDMVYVGADQQRQEAFQAKLPLFGQSITNGYDDPKDMEDALAVAFEREASAYVAQSIQQFNNQFHHNNMGMRPGREEAMPESSAMMEEDGADSAMMAGDSGGGGGATDGVTDFETNNQEENVDEADM